MDFVIWQSLRCRYKKRLHKAPHSGSVSIALPTYEEIANRANELYVEKVYQQDQNEQNWMQSE